MNLTIPEQLDALLGKLKSGIRRYVLLRGLAIFLSAVVVLFWVSLSIDTVWFSSTRLELPRTTRLIILIVGMAVLTVVFFQSVVWQMVVRLKNKALALLLEKRFPELNDRLITLVETAEEQKLGTVSPQSDLSETMLQRTFAETSRMIQQLSVADVFNPRPLQRSIVIASIAIVSVVATAAANPSTIRHWSQAYLRLADDYWNRVNGLDVFVLSQPGDRIRPFEQRVCKHAKGTDLTIQVETSDGKQTPPQALLSYRLATGARGRALMTPAGDGKFRHTIGNLVDDLEFTVTGGDFTTLQSYQVITVAAPQIRTMRADCLYPEYTGWNNPDSGVQSELNISAAELIVPLETQLDLIAEPTKPLISVRISGRDFEVDLTRDPESGQSVGQYRLLDENGVALMQTELLAESSELIAPEGDRVTIPFLLTAAEVELPAGAIGNDGSTPLTAIPIVRTDELRIYLEDEDGIINLEPSRLQLIGQPDEPPVVQTRLSGIGRAVTRKAVLPFIGTITDDYGIAELKFEYRPETTEQMQTAATQREPSGEQRFIMTTESESPAEKFDLRSLELDVDDVLLITLAATDTDTINGPHVSRGERYRLKIVSDEELLSLLYQEELNLRRRFEQVIEQITRARDDLAQAVAGDVTADEFEALVTNSVQRALNTIQKDVIETDAIRAAFASIREELVNNRIDTPQMRNRLDAKIIEPLGRLIETDFAVTEDHLRLIDFSLRNQQATDVTTSQCVADLDQLIDGLAQILLEMRKLESFQEVIELLKGIIEEEKALKEKTEQERKKRLIDLLN